MTRNWRALPLALLLLGGCGMYGPLYLEEPEPPAATTAPPAAVEPGVADPAAAPPPVEDQDPVEDPNSDEERDEQPDPDEDDPAGGS